MALGQKERSIRLRPSLTPVSPAAEWPRRRPAARDAARVRGRGGPLRILTIRESSWLNETPDSVWRRIVALEEWPDWNDGLVEAHWIGRPGWRVGHRLQLVLAGPWRPFYPPGFPWGGFPRSGTVSLVEPEREVRWVGRVLALRVEFAFSMATEGVGTRVEFRSTFRGFAVRIVGQDALVRALSQFQRRMLASMRATGEKLGTGSL